MGYIDKAPASRIIKAQALAWTGSGTSISTTFTAETFQVRVISQINGWIVFEPSATQGTLMSTSTFAGGTYIAANTANGDYFAVSPGNMVMTFTSTTTSSGNQTVSLSEMS
jgi:hypothetical protein